MQKTKIEWCDMVWNPVVGCQHGCKYCYARRMNDRFKFIPNWGKPKFYPERLHQPYGRFPVAKIFVVSMGDLFGNWVPDKWIRAVIGVAANCSMHEFMFLTKNPGRYQDFVFSENCWLGATVEIPDWKGMQRLMDILAIQTQAKKFLSIEPLLGSFGLINLESFDLIIIGAMTGPGAIKPDPDWIDSIKHPNIFLKNNLKIYNQQKQEDK